MFAAIGKNPNFWKDRVSTFIALAPGLFPLRDYTDNRDRSQAEKVIDVIWSLGIHEFLGKNFIKTFGVLESLFPSIASNLYGIYSSLEFNSLQGTQTFTSHFTNGMSLQVGRHLSQNVDANEFREYDYGDEQGKNWKEYGPQGPQGYNMSSLTRSNSPPIYFFSGDQDDIKPVEQVRTIVE